MKILEFNDRGQQVENDSGSLTRTGSTSHLAARPELRVENPHRARVDSDIQLYMFQTEPCEQRRNT